MKPASAKAKGRRFQQWVRDKILACFPTLEPDDVRSTSMGAGGEDILLSPAARKLFPFSVECKARNKIVVQEWMEQAQSNCPKGVTPIVIIKQDRCDPLVLVPASWFFSRKDFS